MRTTVTLDPDTEALVRRRMDERQVSFKRALNDSIREGALRQRSAEPQVSATHPRSMGEPHISLDRALQIAADLEDDELVARMRSAP